MYIFIAGTTKSGTTSIFNYLSHHPSINPCIFKESRYFLSKTYPLPKPTQNNYSKEGFLKFFKDTSEKKLFLEATPDYLGDPETPKLIKDTLRDEKVKFIFILRDPIRRLVSWYNYAKQIGEIDQNEAFEVFIEKNNTPFEKKILPYKVVEQGRYIIYLREYLKYFEKKEVKIILFEKFVNNEPNTMIELCKFCQIDPYYYENYKFLRYNESYSNKFPMLSKIARSIFYQTKIGAIKHPFMFNLLQKGYKRLKKISDRIKLKAKNQNGFTLKDINYKTLKFLKPYYSLYNKELQKEFKLNDIDIKWS